MSSVSSRMVKVPFWSGFSMATMLLLVGTLVIVALQPSPALASHDGPAVVLVPADSHPPIPDGLKATCVVGPFGSDSTASSPTCPVLQWNGYTYWAYSYLDNRDSLNIVAYNAAGEIAAEFGEFPGARYIWQITVDDINETVTFWGQGAQAIVVAWETLYLPPTYGQACLYAGSLSRFESIGESTEPTVSCSRGTPIVLMAGSDYLACEYAGAISQVGTTAPASCGRGERVGFAAGSDYYACLYAGSLSRVGTSEPANCGRGIMIGLAGDHSVSGDV